MEIKQKRGSATTRYVFHDDRLEYAWSDRSGSRNFSVPCIEVSRDRRSLTARSTWFRNVGLLWMGIGLVWILGSWSRNHGANGWLWFALGAGCYATYHFRATRYVIIPCEKGNLLVLEDGGMLHLRRGTEGNFGVAMDRAIHCVLSASGFIAPGGTPI